MKIFISHASQDNKIVHRILKILDDNEIEKWVDLEQLYDPDSDINERINDGLASSDYFLLIWSQDAAKSEFVKKEYNSAISNDYDKRLKKIILRLDDCLLPPLLASKKYHKINEDELDAVFDEIITKIKKINEETQIKDFDDFLDEAYGESFIANYKYQTSFAFKRVDPISYQYELQNWLESE